MLKLNTREECEESMIELDVADMVEEHKVIPIKLNIMETMEKGKEVPIKLDMIDMVVEHKKISIKLNVVEEDEEAPPILKF